MTERSGIDERFWDGIAPEPEPSKCGACDHDPACGHAALHTDDGTTWYCHTDDHSCYTDRYLS